VTGTTGATIVDRQLVDSVPPLVEIGPVVVRQLGGRRELLKLASSMGRLMEPGVGMASGLHDGVVYTIEVRNNGLGVTDVYGNVIISSTSREFPLHTDGFNLPVPPRYVLLMRMDDEPRHTPTFIASFEQALDRSPQLRDHLIGIRVPSARGLVSVVGSDGSAPTYRLNPEEIERWSDSAETSVASRDKVVLAELSVALSDVASTVTLETGDLLVLDNWRFSHGRPELDVSSRRRLARVWVAPQAAFPA
jgi:alpha-ketoglutarate-dependent taurine dioxygenase